MGALKVKTNADEISTDKEYISNFENRKTQN